MVNRFRAARATRDQGFTLIELLVVIIIIGLLAAIAIPVFMRQRQKGVDAGLKADMKNLSTAAETYAIDNHGAAYYGTVTPPTNASVTAALGSSSGVQFRKTPGNVVEIKGSPLDGYCIRARNDGGSMGTASSYYFFDSQNGGLLAGAPQASVTGGACGAAGTWYSVS